MTSAAKAMPMKTACRLEVLGKASSMSYSAETQACLVTTILNGVHVFHTNNQFYGANLATGLSASDVESYPVSKCGEDPLLSCCFLGSGEYIALGAITGTISVLSRRSHDLTGCYTLQESAPVSSLSAVPQRPSCTLVCTQSGADVVDVERSALVFSLGNPAPRAVSAVALSSTTFAMANYDGKVLLYDSRRGAAPTTILSIPDQITTLAVCPQTAQTCVGTVGGRVLTLRCVESAVREQAFGTGKRRSPIRALSICRGRIAAGDLSGRLALIDTADVPDPTVYWTPETLLSGVRQGSTALGPSTAPPNGANVFADAEVSATALSEGVAWAAFTSPEASTTQVVALPA